MIPVHHVPEDWILAYATGSIEPSRQLLLAVHLTYCPACRERVRLAERVGSFALVDAPAAPLPTGGFDQLLARLDEPAPEPPAPVASKWPTPLAPFVTHERWSWLAPYTWGIDLDVPTDGELPARLVWMSPGAHLPHTNGGEECAVILQGGWADETGHYEKGDFAHAHSDEHHDQRIDPGDPCIALVLNERRAIPGAPWSLLRPLFKV